MPSASYTWPEYVNYQGVRYRINHLLEQPLLAGSDLRKRIIYFDRGWQPMAEVEDSTGKRRPMDRLYPVIVHEVEENHAETELGKPYLQAHTMYANPAEKQAVLAMGFNWESYQDSFKGEIKRCSRESHAEVPAGEMPFAGMRKRRHN